MEDKNNDLQWQRKDLHWRDERRRAEENLYQVRGVLLLLALAGALLLNAVLAGSFQIMTGFPCPEPAAVLEEFPGYTLLDSRQEETMAAFLIAAPGGKPMLVTAEKHFLFDRWQMVSEDNTSADPTVVRGDAWAVNVCFSQREITDFDVRTAGLDTNVVGLPAVIPFRVLLLSLGLTAMELGLWALLRKLRKM